MDVLCSKGHLLVLLADKVMPLAVLYLLVTIGSHFQADVSSDQVDCYVQ